MPPGYAIKGTCVHRGQAASRRSVVGSVSSRSMLAVGPGQRASYFWRSSSLMRDGGCVDHRLGIYRDAAGARVDRSVRIRAQLTVPPPLRPTNRADVGAGAVGDDPDGRTIDWRPTTPPKSRSLSRCGLPERQGLQRRRRSFDVPGPTIGSAVATGDAGWLDVYLHASGPRAEIVP